MEEWQKIKLLAFGLFPHLFFRNIRVMGSLKKEGGEQMGK